MAPEAAKDLLTGSNDLSTDLTDREREVLLLLAQGMTNKQIGKQLHLSPFTVRHHVSQLIKKLGAANRAAVVATATQRGLIS
jgi:DNA-binding NarL/FixJ family response regulator